MPDGFDGSGSSPDSSSKESGTQSGKDRLLEGLAEHIKARGELLFIEAREAREALGRRGALASATGAIIVIGYGLILIAGISLLGRWLDDLAPGLSGIGWQVSALAAGLVHLALALLLFRKLKQKRDLNLFEFTRAEFNKDGEWLNQVKKNSSANEKSS
ncbi:MAG: phage holin family protein [Roseibacillus sp.]|nr:phage holin family protein [Roseibacillus sp.]